MDTLSCLRKQNKVANTGKYRVEKLSPLLSEVQAGNAHQCKGFTDNRHSKTGTLMKLCRAPSMGKTIAAVFFCPLALFNGQTI